MLKSLDFAQFNVVYLRHGFCNSAQRVLASVAQICLLFRTDPTVYCYERSNDTWLAMMLKCNDVLMASVLTWHANKCQANTIGRHAVLTCQGSIMRDSGRLC
jgi:hypothetical protein